MEIKSKSNDLRIGKSATIIVLGLFLLNFTLFGFGITWLSRSNMGSTPALGTTLFLKIIITLSQSLDYS